MGIDGDVHFWPVHQGLVEIFSVRSFGRSTTYSAEGTRARGEKRKKKVYSTVKSTEKNF